MAELTQKEDKILKDYNEAIKRFDEEKNNKEENFIQLKKDNILRIGIKDANGKDTGEHLEFDLEDIEFPLKISEADEKHKKNIEYLKKQFLIIDKKEDKKGKKLLSWKEEEKLKLLKDFYKREEETLDLYLGKGGTQKLLNGRKPYYTMYDDINEMLEPIIPLFKVKADSIKDKIVKKYGNNTDKEVLK